MSNGDSISDSSLLLEFFGNTPLFRIIDFLLENRLRDFTKKEISDGSGVGWTTLYKYWGRLEERNIMKVTRQVGRIKLYQLNEASPIVREIKKIELALIRQSVGEDAVHRKPIRAVAYHA
jgi:hypothetical protein